MIPINDLKRGFDLFHDEYEKKAIDILRSGWYVLGNEVKLFEDEFAEKLGDSVKIASVGNGLDAIYLGLLASGIKQGDEIIVQANGYIATMLAIVRCGAIPVFVEPDNTYNMDVNEIEKAITTNTKGVLVTHLYGVATDMTQIKKVCQKYNLLLFEDCAQSHFAKWNGINTGLIGDVGFFSFYPTKTLGAFGDGGAIVSRNDDIITQCKVLRNYGSDYRYHNIELGYNSRLDEMQAGLLRVKLSHIDELIQNRKKYAYAYFNGINNSKIILPKVSDDCTSVWYQFVLSVENRQRFRDYMLQNGIKTDVNWETPPYLQPALKMLGYKKGDFKVTESICEHIVSIPMMDYMSDEEVNKVISIVNKF